MDNAGDSGPGTLKLVTRKDATEGLRNRGFKIAHKTDRGPLCKDKSAPCSEAYGEPVLAVVASDRQPLCPRVRSSLQNVEEYCPSL